MREKEYCEQCGKEEYYIIKEKTYIYEDEECKVTYDGKVAVCQSCGNEIYAEEIEDYNQEQFELAYKKEFEIISKEEIEEIIKKYNIGKRPLSKILNLGEITITRYLDGYIPTTKNSMLLKKILQNPDIYYGYLQKNKSLITELAYKKSMKALNKILHFTEDTILENIATYIVQKERVSNLVLQKLLYYSQVFHYVFKDKFLFTSSCGAWEHGPVYGKIYFKYKNFGYDEICDNSSKYDISEEQREIVDAVIKYFGCYAGNVLAYFTHCEDPWKQGRANDSYINEELLASFALELKEKYSLKNLPDMKKYSDTMFALYQTRNM